MPFGVIVQMVIVVMALGLLLVTTVLTARLLLANQRPILVALLVLAMASVVGSVVAISQEAFCRQRIEARQAHVDPTCSFRFNLSARLGSLLRLDAPARRVGGQPSCTDGRCAREAHPESTINPNLIHS